MDAIREAFPESTVKGCTFHFRQALVRRVSEVGLRCDYISGMPLIKDWIRQVMGLTLLPVVLIPLAWEYLKFPPDVGNAELASKMTAFASYFERTWLSGSFPQVVGPILIILDQEQRI